MTAHQVTSRAPASGRRDRAWPRSTIRRGILAAALAAGANAAMYTVGAAFGAFPETVVIPQAGEPISLGPVVFTSLVGALGGTAVYAAVRRFTRRPVQVFRITSAVVLVLSFATPLTIPGAPVSMVALLELMHVVVAGVTVWVLTRGEPPAGSHGSGNSQPTG